MDDVTDFFDLTNFNKYFTGFDYSAILNRYKFSDLINLNQSIDKQYILYDRNRDLSGKEKSLNGDGLTK